MAENKNALPIGTILNDRYEIESLIGGGGFGLVYRAKQTYLNNVVVIKELFPRDIVVRRGKVVHPVSEADAAIYQKVLSSFLKEGHRLVSLDSCPSIVRCLNYFEENGTGYLVLKHIKGRSLREVVRSYRSSNQIFSEASLISLLNKLLQGLKEVHKAGIQHMDIKPENIYVGEKEGMDDLSNPVLLDFGASRSQTGHSTGSSLLVGTAPYASIEQIHKRDNIGPWTDIYALGITLYELMFRTDEIPSCTERISDIHNRGLDPLKSAKSRGIEQYSDKLLRLVDRCIQIKAKDRPQNVEEIESLLRVVPLPKPEPISKLSGIWFRISRTKTSVTIKVPLDKKIATFIGIFIILVAIGGYIYVQSLYQVGETFRDCATCPEMVVLPEGKFMMGAPEEEEGRENDEGPQRQVTIPKLAVGKYEVTVGQYAEFVKEIKNKTGHKTGNCDIPKGKSWDDPGFNKTNDHPVVCVSWDDASAYADWLSTKTGYEYRLLTEAEWEYAARAGTTTAYYFGSTISKSQANFDINIYGTALIGSYPANAFGLHDMHGNVREWVEDCWHDGYTDAPTNGSAWISLCNDSKHILRGGSWWDSLEGLRSANRFRDIATNRINVNGIRVARTLTPSILKSLLHSWNTRANIKGII